MRSDLNSYESDLIKPLFISSMNSENRVFFFVALACEAKPVIARYRLKKQTDTRQFSLYSHDGIYLIVTGIGKIAMSAGVAFSQGLLGGHNPILINVGIAGHRDHCVNTPFIGHKIIDADTKRSFYPPLTYTLPCDSETILTTSHPQLNYDHGQLSDMEASAFYESAVRFSSGELIQCLKVVSDNPSQPAGLIEAVKVTHLIEQNIPALEKLLTELRSLQSVLTNEQDLQHSELTGRFRFSVTEKAYLKYLLQRWHVINSNKTLDINLDNVKSGKDLLNLLNQKLAIMDYDL
jgi:adenosylhomocysteine nucleosidase